MTLTGEQLRSKVFAQKQSRNYLVDRATVDKEARTVPILFSVGSPVVRWWGIEVLNMNPTSVRLERWKNKPPFLMNHNIEDQRGAIENGTLANGELRGNARLSKHTRGEELLVDILDEIRPHVSIGYIIHDARELKPEEMSEELKKLALEESLPVYDIFDWEPLEGSSVWLGADRNTGVGREYELEVEARSKQSPTQSKEGSDMTPEEIAAANRKAAEDAVRADRARVEAIDQMAREFAHVTGIEALRTQARNEGWDVNKFTGEAVRLQQSTRAEIDALAAQFKSFDGIEALRTQARNESWPLEKFRDEAMKIVRAGGKSIDTAAPPANPDVRMRDIVQPWQRRAVVGLSQMVARFKGSESATRKWSERMGQLEREFNKQQQDAEIDLALKRVMDSKMPFLQQYRLMSTLTGGAGGYLVTPAPLLAEIFVLVEAWGDARRFFRPVPMVTDKLKLNSLVTKAIAYHVAQGANITASDLAFGQGELETVKIAGISSWSHEADEDQAIALLPIWVESIAEAISELEDLDGFVGDGAGGLGTSSTFTGLLNFGTQVVTMDAGKISITDADADDYRALRDAVPRRHRAGAMFFLSPDNVSRLEGMKNLQGDYIYRPPSGDLPARLWGLPIANNDGIEALAAVTDAAAKKFAICCNPNNMLMGQRREVETVVSNEGVLQAGDGTIAFNALQADGAIVRTTERVGFKGVRAGAIAVLKSAAA